MKQHKTIEDLIQKVSDYLPEADIVKIKDAHDFAKDAHKEQTRLSGDPYILHPVEVAYILADLEQDTSTICAGLLHDVLEDTDANHEILTKKFGEDIYQLVDGVTKLSKISFESKEEAQAENFRKMFLAMAKDIRVVIIKLADRLHNMRTLKHMSKEKQIRIAEVTREIYSALAHRLGMWRIKWELEDLTFYYLQYNEFQEIKRLVSSRREEREGYIENFIYLIEKLLSEHQVKAKVTGRPKHFYSIYKKLTSQNLSFDELYDTLGIRIIVKDIRQCYETLGLVHAAFKPVNGRFKDYIAMPKSNMYQSLHSTVIGPKGKPVEVQIRTVEMDQIGEYGVAAHWRYKEGKTVKSYDADFAWLRQIIEQNQEKTAPDDFMQNLKIDLFIDEVFVFTPKGAVQTMARGSTPIDFAYRIHTEIGHCCIGAKINGHIVSLDYVLQSGDRVEILTSKKPQPKIDWLHFVQTGQAKTRIKQWFKRENIEETRQKGKIKIDKLLLINGLVPKEILTKATIESILKKFKVSQIEDLYLSIGQGDFSAKDLFDFIITLHPLPSLTEPTPAIQKIPPKDPKPTLNNVQVLGEDNVLAYIAKCCTPLPGDPIVGFITLGHGVAIHHSDCKQILNLDPVSKNRVVDSKWTHTASTQLYSAILRIEAFDRIGILKDILDAIAQTKTNIVEIKTKTLGKGGKMRAYVSLNIKDAHHLNQVKNVIATLPDVISIKRSKDTK